MKPKAKTKKQLEREVRKLIRKLAAVTERRDGLERERNLQQRDPHRLMREFRG